MVHPTRGHNMWLSTRTPHRSPVTTQLTLALVVSALVSWAGIASAAPPVLTVPGPQSVLEGDQLQFTIQASDPDGDTIFLMGIQLPPGATFDDMQNNTGVFTWTPASDQAGSYVATFLADDTFGGMDQESVSITVRDLNLPPELNAIGDKSVERGTMLNAFASAWDPEEMPLTFSTINMPAYGSLTDFGNGTANLAFSPGPQTPLGTTSMTVVVSDGVFTDSETFNVTVTASSAQSPPVLSTVGNQTVAEGSTRNVDVSASDADGDVLQWTSALPSFAALTPLTSNQGSATARLVVRPGPCDAGNYAANISVNDGVFSDYEAFTITVTDVNRTPVWNAPSGGYSMTVQSGSSGLLQVSGSDQDQACGGSAPALSVVGTSAGDAIQASLEDGGNGTGVLRVMSAGPSGSFSVTIRATDRADQARYSDTSVAVRVEGGVPVAMARAWADQDPLRLQIGKPRDRVYLEPIGQSFTLDMVKLDCIHMTAWEGSGTVESVKPLPDKFELGTDRDQNGVRELRMEFLKDDLRALLSNVTEPGHARLVLHAKLNDGREIEAALEWEVVPERHPAIRKIGPNPLNPEATILVRADRDGAMTVRIFDLTGRLVRTVEESRYVSAGDHQVRFDGMDDNGRRLSSGRYFVRVDVSGVRDTGSLTIVK